MNNFPVQKMFVVSPFNIQTKNPKIEKSKGKVITAKTGQKQFWNISYLMHTVTECSADQCVN